MDYLDMLKGLADEDGEVDPQEAKSILNGARDRLEALESERAKMYQEWRDEGKDPNEEWAQLPE